MPSDRFAIMLCPSITLSFLGTAPSFRSGAASRPVRDDGVFPFEPGKR